LNSSELKRAYFIGIGGIGMSAIARYMLREGVEIFGYDKTCTALTKKLESEGMKIHYETRENEFPENLDLVVYTPAIPRDHAELNFFLRSEIPTLKRSEILGLIAKRKKSIAIAGTHGKTTTSAILSHILTFCKLDASVFVGGIMVNYESNFIHGKSDWVVLEADEYDRSFLQLDPDIAAIISIDPDHLDIYEDHDKMIQSGFAAFSRKIKTNGSLFVSSQSWSQLKGMLEDDLNSKKVDWKVCGIGEGDCYAENIREKEAYSVFDWVAGDERIENILTSLPGDHNILNATIAIGIARMLGIEGDQIKNAIHGFEGIKRRFEMIYRARKFCFIDDYAHHPSELKAAISTARKHFPGKRILGIFQPHLYSRTRDFVDGFIDELSELDAVILLPIYPAREKPIEGVNSGLIYKGLRCEEKYLVPKKLLIDTIENIDFEIIMTLGAGDIDACVDDIKQYLINAETVQKI
jgi:UDP-N-acetylmuramate--alanine ligase